VWLFQAPLLPEAPIAAHDFLAPSSSLDFLKDSSDAHRSAYAWLFQAPLLPEALLAAHDFEAIDKAFTDAGQMGVQSPGESLLPLK